MGYSFEVWRELVKGRDDADHWLAQHPESPTRASQFKGGAGGCYRLTIPGWRPATFNQLLRSVKARIRLKKRDRAIVAQYAALARIPHATGPRRVHLAITVGKGQQAGDVDAPWKSLLDALVHAKLLIDDDTEHCVLDPVEFVKGREPETTIELTDVESHQ